jgi:eukaryotic-like serine/threonine-protein kinase
MELSRKQWLEQAQALEKRGEAAAAAQAFVRAGACDDAVRLFLSVNRYQEAGQVLLRSIEYDPRNKPDANQRKIALKAAICFSRGRDVRQAVELFLAIGERGRAVQLLQEMGDFVNASRLEADPTGQTALLGYEKEKSVPAEAAASVEGARNLERAGKLESAMEAYARLKQWPNAARLAQRLGQTEKAARFFAEAGQPFEAAACFHELPDGQNELEQLLKVPEGDAHYREACVRAIAIASDRADLTFELEHFLNRFISLTPSTDEEIDAIYRLALLFEGHAFPENAATCYRKILAVRSGYRDVSDRLKAAETDFRGTAAKDYERVFKEEQVFREAVKRHEAPAKNVGPDDEDQLGPLPDLPDLPDLPELPQPADPASPQPAAPHAHTFQMSIGHTPSPSAVPAAIDPELTWGPGSHEATGNRLEPGAVIHQRYRLEIKIGQGGMGAVWKATDLELDEVIAIKFLSAQLVDEDALTRFKQEVSLSRHFNHPNIVRLYDIGTCADQRYITMELLRGQDLSKVMQAAPLDFDRGLALLIQACNALQIVHDQGVIHRDIKPDNFFITDEGVLKVMDFGISKHHKAGRGLTQAGMMAGTPQYMAPEQANNFAGVTHLADIYALGCIAYQMFTGTVPFDAQDFMPILMAHMNQAPDPPRQRNPAIPAELEAVILKLLAKNPKARVQSCHEVAALFSGIRLRLPRR